MSSSRKIRCLIVDDSAVIRSILQTILSSDPAIEVVGTAQDPYAAREKLIELQPDVMTLDIQMPRMDGVSFLERVMAAMPTRTMFICDPSGDEPQLRQRALAAGAIDIYIKPSENIKECLMQVRDELLERVKAVARSPLPFAMGRPLKSRLHDSSHTDASQPRILAVAASTGGTEALKVVLRELPADIPGTLIVQHMPPIYTRSFAESLQRICRFQVKEAAEGDRVKPGLALIAPGDYHMELVRSGSFYSVKLHQEAPEHSVRPAADVLMRSVAKVAGRHALGLVLTGMGRDAAQGLLAMHQAGSYNIAQDEASSIAAGMPRAAVDIGAIDKVLPLEEIAAHLIRELQKRQARAS